MRQPISLDDAELAQLVAQGNRQAFIELYDRHAARVHALAIRMLREKMATEEDTQDAFLKLWIHTEGYPLLACRRAIQEMSPLPQRKFEILR